MAHKTRPSLCSTPLITTFLKILTRSFDEKHDFYWYQFLVAEVFDNPPEETFYQHPKIHFDLFQILK